MRNEECGVRISECGAKLHIISTEIQIVTGCIHPRGLTLLFEKPCFLFSHVIGFCLGLRDYADAQDYLNPEK